MYFIARFFAWLFERIQWHTTEAINASETETMPKTPDTAPLPVNEPVRADSGPTALVKFCEAIRDFEGKPGDANYLNNNPGNCRCSSVGYLPKYGEVKCSPHGFAIFPTYELGFEYLQNLVHFRALKHPEWTIYDFFADYAPTSDQNQPQVYAKFVASRCGVIPTCTLKELFS